MMNKRMYILISLITATFLVGCGSGSDSEAAVSKAPVVMELTTTYEVYPGNEIVADEASELVIDHQYGNEYKTVILTSGSARLFR